MSYTIGDGMVTFALAGSIVGYLYVKHQSRQKRIEIIHQERMAAMEKGKPLAEVPLEPARERRPPDPTVVPILGTVLLSLSVGTMIVLALILEAPSHGFWVAPLPFTFLGVGLIAGRAMVAAVEGQESGARAIQFGGHHHRHVADGEMHQSSIREAEQRFRGGLSLGPGSAVEAVLVHGVFHGLREIAFQLSRGDGYAVEKQ